MNRARLVIGLAILVGLGSGTLGQERLARAEEPQPKQSDDKKSLPPGLSSRYENGYREMDRWLDKKLVEWKPSEYRPMHFMGFHLPISTEMRNYTDSTDDLRFLDMLIESGADVISVGVVGAPEDMDKSLLERYDKLFTEIRNKNKKLKIWLRTFVYGPKVKPEKAYAATEYIIKKWKPDYYAITHEPKDEEEKAKEHVKEWVGKTCEIAKKIDPNVKTSATAINYKNVIDYVDVFVEMPHLDIVGFDIYNIWGLDGETPGGNIIEDKIKLIHSKGKESWIEEFWLSSQWKRPLTNPPETFEGFNDPRRAWWDARFIRVMAYYAQKNNLIGIEPWFTNYFLLYPGYDDIWKIKGKMIPGSRYHHIEEQRPTDRYLRDFRAALAQKKRTPAFYEFKKMVEEVNGR